MNLLKGNLFSVDCSRNSIYAVLDEETKKRVENAYIREAEKFFGNLQAKWAEIPQEVVQRAVDAFGSEFQIAIGQIVKNTENLSAEKIGEIVKTQLEKIEQGNTALGNSIQNILVEQQKTNQSITEVCKKLQELKDGYDREVSDINKAVEASLEAYKKQHIDNLRQNLLNAVHEEFLDTEAIKSACRELKNFLPQDFQAEFYEVICGGNVKKINNFILHIDLSQNSGYVKEVVEFMCKILKPDYFNVLDGLLTSAHDENYIDAPTFGALNKQLRDEKKKLDDQVYNPRVKRDVFVAYKSEDKVKVEELINELALNDITYFVSYINLQHSIAGDYSKKLSEALDACKMIVFVSSYQSRTMGDAKEELNTIRKWDVDTARRAKLELGSNANSYYDKIPSDIKKLRLEYVIENYKKHDPKEEEVKEFFKGFEQVYNLDDAVNAIKRILRNYNPPLAPKPITTSGDKTHTHVYSGHEVTLPTCTERGYTSEYCKVCGDIRATFDYKDPLGHDWGAWTTIKPATCAEYGEEKRVCKRDSNHTESRTIPKIDHTPSNWITDKVATCAQTGSRHKECTICKTELERENIAPLGHDWGAWTTIKLATCAEYGEKKRVCKRDSNHIERTLIPKTDHTPGRWIIDKAATCTESGSRHKECKKCKAVIKRETIPPKAKKTTAERVSESKMKLSRILFYISAAILVGLIIAIIFYGLNNDLVWNNTCSTIELILMSVATIGCGAVSFIFFWGQALLKEDMEEYQSKKDVIVAIIFLVGYVVIVGLEWLIAWLHFTLNWEGGISLIVLLRFIYLLLTIIYLVAVRIIYEIGNIWSRLQMIAFYVVTIAIYVASVFGWCRIDIDTYKSSFYYNGFYYELDGNEVSITSYEDTTVTILEIPSSIRGNEVTSIKASVFENCSGLRSIYYTGTEESWNKILIGSKNTYLTNVTCYYYSKTKPTTHGKWWHYVDGVPTVWPHDGNYTAVVTPATCTEQGYTTYTCDVCGDEYEGDYTEALGHNYVDNKCTTCGEYSPDYSDEYTEGLKFTLNSKGTEYSVTGYTWSNAKVIIPEIYKGLKVTSIGSNAFYKCSGLRSVTIPSSVTSIGGNAFYGCSSLTSVYINDIAAWCNISFGDLEANPLNYAQNLYLNGTVVTELVIPNSVTSIGNYAFWRYDSLTSVTIPNSVMRIGGYAFSICSKLTSVYISDMEAWCNISFGNSSSNPLNYAQNLYLNGTLVTDLTIPNSVTSIGNYAFYYCRSLTSVTIPNSVTSIGESAFNYCSKLTSVYISDMEAWCNISFGDASSNPLNYAQNLYLNSALVAELTISNGVTNIGNYAFYGYISLTSVTIGNNVTSIGVGAFSGCKNLIGIEVVETNAKYRSIDGVLFDKEKTTLICYPAGKSGESYIIPNSVTSIGSYTFYNCSSLTSVIIPDSVTSIERSAFSGCSKLTVVYYTGTEESWNKILIESENTYLTKATCYYYSETKPTTDGKWWHYVDGVPTAWE